MRNFYTINKHSLDDCVTVTDDKHLCVMTCPLCEMPYAYYTGSNSTGDVKECPGCKLRMEKRGNNEKYH